MRYGFISKRDSTLECIAKGEFETLNEAVEAFAQRKQLTIDLFLEMYEVIPL
jgi:hypothetical protein